MSISQRLETRQSQSLVMTPQLQQAIKLLQMSNQELGAFVDAEVEQNPLLEAPEEEGRYVVSQSVGGEATASSSPGVSLSGAGEASAPAAASNENESEPTFETDDAYGSGEEYAHADGGSSHSGGDETFSAAQNVAVETNLREYLLEQINVDFLEPAERLVGVALIELLDEAGYLPADLTLVRSQMGVTEEFFEEVVQNLQRLDPPGIFARSLKECLSIQLREKNRLDPAMAALLDHLELLGRREHAALMRLCGVDAEDLVAMIEEIRALDPKPATAFTVDVAPPIVPDVFLRPKAGGGWSVELNSETLPRVLANEIYYTTVQKTARSKDEKEYLSERWQQANWLVKALHQRATTILKVAAEIVRHQDKFFVHGVQYLRPLVLREIAEAVEMHESTVSRVTQNKYIATPRGVFELKYFFTNAIATTGGEEVVSSLAVRERIKALIDAEEAEAILSDDKIMALLRQEGIDIARRTVAKYREGLGLASSSQRRREKRAF